MTIGMCLSTCRDLGYRFSGLQWQIECYCGNNPVKGFQWAWPDKCNEKCAGNSNQICGGSNAMSLYSTPNKNLNGLCVYNFPSPNNVLNEISISNPKNMTIENCRRTCQG